METCRRCGEGTVVTDTINDVSTRVCNSCGVVLSTDEFRHTEFTRDGQREGTFLDLGTFDSRARRISLAGKLIADVTSRLGLSAARADEALRLASDATDGDLGSGDWFAVFAAACSYVSARRSGVPIPAAEAAAAVGCDALEVSRMAARLCDHLDLDPLPEFDTARSLERAVRSAPGFKTLDRSRAGEVIGQGIFLLRCAAAKWSLSTGRHPMPLVAAAAALALEINNVDAGGGIDAISKHIHANASTSRRRYRELSNSLLCAARVLLPWGKDVNAKNLLQHAPLLIRTMELKSRTNPSNSGVPESFCFDFNEFLGEYSSKGAAATDAGENGPMTKSRHKESEAPKLSVEALAGAYERAAEAALLPSEERREEEITGSEMLRRSKLKLRMEMLMNFDDSETWELEKGMSHEEAIERDVGYEALPPSFVAGIKSRKRIRSKVEAAKRRILEIMKPSCAGSLVARMDECASVGSDAKGKRKRKRKGFDFLDWQDRAIELLLLHRVPEDEIEEGQFRRLLELHVLGC